MSIARSTPAQNERGAASRTVRRPTAASHCSTTPPRWSRLHTQIATEGADREDQPVEVVVDVEVAGEAGAGELRLIPAAVCALCPGQPCDTARDPFAPVAS